MISKKQEVLNYQKQGMVFRVFPFPNSHLFSKSLCKTGFGTSVKSMVDFLACADHCSFGILVQYSKAKGRGRKKDTRIGSCVAGRKISGIGTGIQ